MSENIDSNLGAKFLRADLHIHSYGEEGSFDVSDALMTPENIVDTAISKGLQIIAITDHNEIGNVKKALQYSENKQILIIPGIEVSTAQGHLLVYFESFNNLKSFHSRLNITRDKQGCTQSIVDCLNLAEQSEGIGVLAHIELTSGFEKTIGRFGPQMEDVLTHPNLWALEISNKSNLTLYTDNDSNQERKKLLNLRREKLLLDDDFDFPKLMSSDSHTIVKLGTNAEGENKLTRIKIDSLNFQAFKIALISHVSRIRLEEFIPERIPKFTGLKIEGGLLDNQIIKFSNNLTCIIGGRGTGKSTLLESIKESSGNPSTSTLVDCDVWPEKILLHYEDETGRAIILTREKNSNVINTNDPVNGITKIEIECYGQGETANTIQHSDQNPEVLIDFLDTFIDITALETEDEDVRNLIIDNQSQINKLRVEIAGIPEIEKHKINLEGKLEQLKKDKVGELVKYQTALLKEREIRNHIIKDLKELIRKYKDILSDKSVFENFNTLTDDEILVGKDNFTRVKEIVKEFSVIVNEKAAELSSSLNEKITELNSQIDDWSKKEQSIQLKIDEKKRDLESKGIPFDIGKINQISRDVLYYQNRLKKLQQDKKDLAELMKLRKEQLKKRRDLKNKIYYERGAFASVINDNLKNAVDGLFVKVKYGQGVFSPQFEEAIKTAMDWRTSQVPKAKILANSISPIDFAEGVKAGNLDLLKAVTDDDGNRIFSDAEIVRIISRISENLNYEDFESIKFDDKPSIIVTKVVTGDDGHPKHISRTLSKLSLGQQQSILLAILLQSKSKAPLIIDQPEDNLDSEFIYKTIVANLRKIKERRQVIIVTHNPNIAVLGDAELIIPLKSSNIKSHIVERGSIDRPETRIECCSILEGGKQAFIKRKEIYGI